MPAPRENPGLAAGVFRWAFTWPYRAVLAGLLWLRVRAWHVTALSLMGNLVTGGLLLTGRRLVPGIVFLASGVLDVLDGGVARMRGEESRKGALLDSVIDRASDGVVFGCLFVSLARGDDALLAVLALVAMVVSLQVSHVRAEGEAAGLRVSGGLVQRLERYVALTIGLMVPGALFPVLALLAALGLATTVQRFVVGWRQLPTVPR